MKKNRIFLMILDGWGDGQIKQSSAIANANIPFITSLYTKYPHNELVTYGMAVGLPEGQMGNSEVGHLNIGAGRIVYQELQHINKEIEKKLFEKQPILLEIFEKSKANQKPLHLIGLVSDGGIHSHINHLICTIESASLNGVKEIYIHAFLDGRDTDPKSGLNFITQLEKVCDKYGAKIASICGRYYAMDRDKRWERVKIAYDLMVHKKGQIVDDFKVGIENFYNEGITDEFMKPMIHSKDYKPIENGDIVFCFNFRTDRCREITQVLTQEDFKEFDMVKLSLEYYTMTNYNEKFKGIGIVYKKENLPNTLGEVLAKNNKTQLRIAETEKYPHVTFFFSGGREQPFLDEKRIMLPSPKVATYDLMPEMSAYLIKDMIIAEMQKNAADFICLNFANADMVGHTGNFNAAIKAVEAVDSCVSEIVAIGLEHGYSFIIIADHGNADYMINADGSPNTAHSKNPVPIIIIDENVKKVLPGKLADIAPTILKMMNIPQPIEMDGSILIG